VSGARITAMRSITLSIPEPGQWDAYYSVQDQEDHLFCPTDRPLTVGEVLRVKVIFQRGPQFYVTGVVMWRRAKSQSRSRLKPGVGLRLNGSERSKVAYIRGFARGGLLDKRGAPRIPVRLRVTYRAGGARRVNFTRDITTSGLLVSVAEVLPLDEQVQLTVMPPADLAPQRLVGTVVRHVEDDRGRAMGVRLDFEDAQQQARYEELVHQVEGLFRTGELGEAHIAQ